MLWTIWLILFVQIISKTRFFACTIYGFFHYGLIFCFQIAAQLNKAFDDFFPASTGVKIIAEPGTFFASSVYTLVCKVLVVKQPEQGPFRNEKKDQVR